MTPDDQKVRHAVYYNYEGETMIVYSDGPNSLCVETYTERGLNSFMSITIDDWKSLVRAVEDLI